MLPNKLVRGIVIASLAFGNEYEEEATTLQKLFETALGVKKDAFYRAIDYLVKHGYICHFLDGQRMVCGFRLYPCGVRLLTGEVTDRRIQIPSAIQYLRLIKQKAAASANSNRPGKKTSHPRNHH